MRTNQSQNVRGTHGGRRRGAGRPRGERDRAVREAYLAAAEAGELPVDYMLRVMREESVDEKRRDAMAVAVAPYFHPKLRSLTHTGLIDLRALTDEQLALAEQFFSSLEQ